VLEPENEKDSERKQLEINVTDGLKKWEFVRRFVKANIKELVKVFVRDSSPELTNEPEPKWERDSMKKWEFVREFVPENVKEFPKFPEAERGRELTKSGEFDK
jgi:hypothetical protein